MPRNLRVALRNTARRHNEHRLIPHIDRVDIGWADVQVDRAADAHYAEPTYCSSCAGQLSGTDCALLAVAFMLNEIDNYPTRPGIKTPAA